MTLRTVDTAVSLWDAGFEEGRKFRSYLYQVIPVAGPAVSARFVATVDFTLELQKLSLTQGALQLLVYTGATGSGTWTTISPIAMNRASTIPQPPYVAQNHFDYGGSFTGGTEIDRLMVRAVSQNVTASNVADMLTLRKLPAGTYYMQFATLTGGLSPTDAAQMKYSIEWTEHP